MDTQHTIDSRPRKISSTSSEWIGPLPSVSLKVVLDMYKMVNHSGFLHTRIGSQLFSKVYFAYKSLFGDNFKALVKKNPALFAGGHIIDVGANIGYTAFLFNSVLTKGYKVFAFEPELKNFVELERLIKNEHLEETIIPLQIALGESKRTAKLWKNPTSHADHRIVDENIALEGEREMQDVSMQSLDAFLEERGIEKEPLSFIKIDVQGFEGPVIKGMQKTLERNPKAALVFEYSPYTMKQLGFAPEELVRSLLKEGYRMQVLNKDGSLSPFDTKIQSSGEFGEYFDILCQKPCN